MQQAHLMIKFGRKEDLEQLKEGTIYFSKLQTHRDDTTAFRGDFTEGKIAIDPDTLSIQDSAGGNIFNSLPRPDNVYLSNANDGDLLVFCCSIITDNILEENLDGTKTFSKGFRNEMVKFGDYAMCFWEYEIQNKLVSAAKENSNLFYEYGAITYCDKSDFSSPSNCNTHKSMLSQYFTKDIAYKFQNEWRVIIDGKCSPLELNRPKGFVLETSPFEKAAIYKSKDLVKTFEWRNFNA